MSTIPVFDLQTHHSKVKVPTDFDMRDLSRKYNVFPLKVITQGGRKRLLLAMQDPRNQEAIHDVEFRSGVSVVPVQADLVDIQWLIQVHYFGRKLSPTPKTMDGEVTHDVYEQLTMTTDAQNRPDWLGESLNLFSEDADAVKANS